MKWLSFLIAILALAVGCEKVDPFTESNEGNNILGFYLDGQKISNETSGGFPSEYPHMNCVYARAVNVDTLEISASLDSGTYPDIYIKIPFSDISTTRMLENPDIALVYLYRRYPKPPGEFTDGGIRKEYAYTDFVSGQISFRKWDEASKILSGNFSFKCDAPQFDGSVKHLTITRGNFDVQYELNSHE